MTIYDFLDMCLARLVTVGIYSLGLETYSYVGAVEGALKRALSDDEFMVILTHELASWDKTNNFLNLNY